MQKEIFDDLAWQHEAYMLGGAALMQDIHRRHPDEIDARTPARGTTSRAAIRTG